MNADRSAPECSGPERQPERSAAAPVRSSGARPERLRADRNRNRSAVRGVRSAPVRSAPVRSAPEDKLWYVRGSSPPRRPQNDGSRMRRAPRSLMTNENTSRAVRCLAERPHRRTVWIAEPLPAGHRLMALPMPEVKSPTSKPVRGMTADIHSSAFAETLRAYRYQSPPLSIFERLYLERFWDFLAARVYPAWLAPTNNTHTETTLHTGIHSVCVSTGNVPSSTRGKGGGKAPEGELLAHMLG